MRSVRSDRHSARQSRRIDCPDQYFLKNGSARLQRSDHLEVMADFRHSPLHIPRCRPRVLCLGRWIRCEFHIVIFATCLSCPLAVSLLFARYHIARVIVPLFCELLRLLGVILPNPKEVGAARSPCTSHCLLEATSSPRTSESASEEAPTPNG